MAPGATIIGSGPNGLSAAILLAASGVRTTVLERNGRICGGCSTFNSIFCRSFRFGTRESSERPDEVLATAIRRVSLKQIPAEEKRDGMGTLDSIWATGRCESGTRGDFVGAS